jgi:lysyl-tRNA synthetase class 2
MFLSEQELQRREKRNELKRLGVNPYPSEEFKINVTASDIKKNYEKRKTDYKDISIAGRLMSIRKQGSAAFAELQDSSGRIQLYLRRDDICPGEDKTMYNIVFKKLVDLGDIVGLTGYVFTTQVGEITIHVTGFQLLSKSLKPLPLPKKDVDGVVHDAFTDPEQRYRQRYVDLVVNPEVKEAFVKRTQMVKAMKDFLDNRNFMEVETPILQPIYGGAAARPFKTFHNTLEMPLFLRIANELYLKRLIVGGFDRVYEFAKDFRNEGMSRFHNPEFTQVELYAAYTDYKWLMDLLEEMMSEVVEKIHKSDTISVSGNSISFQKPWKRLTMFESIHEYTGVDIDGMVLEDLQNAAKSLNVDIDETMGAAKIIDEIFGEHVEPKLINPTFITDYPVEMSPLAKRKADRPELVERFEVICNGKEIANAFSELNDPVDQRERFEEQLKLRDLGDDEAMVLDDDFLRALEYGMPPTAGMGIGIDRLAMIISDSQSIQDVLFFPQMRPEKKEVVPNNADYVALGIPEILIELIQRSGFIQINQIAEANPGALHQKVCGQRKKLKLDVPAPSQDDVKAWVEKAMSVEA